MNHLVKGVLTSSLGEPYPYTPITIIPTRNDSKLLGAEAVFTTNGLGEYEFTLTEGLYDVLIQYSDTKELTGSIVIDEGLPEESTLESLLDYTGTVRPNTFTSTSVTWEDLFNDLESSTFTSTRLIPDTTQDDDGKVFHYNVKGTLFNDTIPSKKSVELTQVKADEVDNIHEVYSYSDTGINEITNTRSYSSTSELFYEKNVTLEHAVGRDPILTDISEYTNGRVSIDEVTSLPDNESHLIKSEVISPEVYDLDQRNSSLINLSNTSLRSHTSGSKTASSDKVLSIDYEDDSYLLEEVIEHKIEVGNSGSILKRNTLKEDIFGDVLAQELHLNKVGGIEYSSLLTNDGSTTSKEILVDNLVIGSKSNDLVHVDTFNNEVNINGRLNISFVNIPDLEHGRTIYDEYRYYFTNSELNFDLWHTVLVTGDKFRIQRTVTDYGDGNITYSQWSTPAYLAGEDGLEGDSLYFEYRYTSSESDGSPDESQWHDAPMIDGDQWRIEREVVKGVAGEWSAPTRIVGADGGDGRGSRLEVEYAATSSGGEFGWHTNYSEGDHWRRERLVTILSDGSEVSEPWQISKLVPELGVDYGYQNAVIFIYKRSKDSPAEPTGEVTYNFATGELTGLDNGWTSNIPEGNQVLWIGAATVWALTPTDVIAPNEWVIEQFSSSGFSAATIMLYRLASSAPNVPDNDITYTFGTGELSGSLDGWSTTVPSNTTEGGRVWVTFNTALSQEESDVLDPSDWSFPSVLSQNGLDGLDGLQGEKGDHGSGSYVYDAIATPAQIRGFSDSQHSGYFTSLSGRAPQKSDIISYTNSQNQSDESLWYRVDFLYSGSTWDEFSNVVDGNMIVHGTVAAHTFVSGTVLTDKLHIGSTENVKSEVTLSGNGDGTNSDARIWAGHANASSAPFMVDKYGKVKATGVDISGKITATSGSFTGAITAGAGSSIDAAYIQDLVVDTLQIKDQAVTQPVSVEFSTRSTSGNTSTTLGSISLGVYSSGGVAFSFAINAERINDSADNDEMASVTVSMYAGGSFVKYYSFSSSLFHDNAEFTIPATGMFTDAQMSSHRGSSLSISVSVRMSGYPSGTAYWSGSGFTMYAKK